jgi:hypothetical protein
MNFVQLDYSEIISESPTNEFKSMASYPLRICLIDIKRISVEDLPQDMLYSDLDKAPTRRTNGLPIPQGTTCTGSKTCEFICGSTKYIITGIPDKCACSNSDGSLWIICGEGCNSYELSCGIR